MAISILLEKLGHKNDLIELEHLILLMTFKSK